MASVRKYGTGAFLLPSKNYGRKPVEIHFGGSVV